MGNTILKNVTKNTMYRKSTKVYENSRIKEILHKIVTKFRNNQFDIFLQLNVNDIKTVNHEYVPSKKLEKPYRILKVLTKFNER